MNKGVAPSVELEAAIEGLLVEGLADAERRAGGGQEGLLAEGLADAERLGELGRLGARLAIQRAVEEEVDGFLGRTRAAA